MLSNKKIFIYLILSILLFSSCKKEELIPPGDLKGINIEKYLAKESLKPRKEKVKIKKKRNKFKIRLIRKQRAL